MGVFGGLLGPVFFRLFIRSPEHFSFFSQILIFLSYLASGFLLIPRPEAEITKCLSRRGRFPGAPRKADFGGVEKSHFFGDPPRSGGRGGGVKSFLLVIYIGRGFGGSSSDKQARRRISNAPPLPEAGAQHYRAGGER